jgi:hypothetical protein
MLYEFQLVGGTEVISRDFRMKDAPEIGSVVEIDGKKWIRIVSADVSFGNQHKYHNYPMDGDISLPRVDAGYGQSASGHPRFPSRKAHVEFGKRNNLVYDGT